MGQNTLAGLCYTTSRQSSGVLITSFMTQVARADGLVPFEGLPEEGAQESRGRLAGTLVYATLDPRKTSRSSPRAWKPSSPTLYFFK